MDNKKIVAFYDDFSEDQKNTGVNDRIYGLYKRLKKLGLNTHSNVLELGCGIGTITLLISKTVKKGTIEAVDISPKSVEFAKKRIKKKNIKFHSHDVVDYNPSLNSIDYITLFDVLEHIPIERHHELFKNISSYMSDNTFLLVNIPNPEYIEYDRKYQPELLQVIDQPVYLDFMIKNLTKNQLQLLSFETYSTWVKNDYNFYLIKKKKEFKEQKLQDERNLIQKILIKLFRIKLKLFYRF